MLHTVSFSYVVRSDRGGLIIQRKRDGADVYLQGDDAINLENVLDTCHNDAQVNDVLSYYFD